MPDIDPYTIRRLDAWLDREIPSAQRRDQVRKLMLAFIADDPEYWGAQSWWKVYDRTVGR